MWIKCRSSIWDRWREEKKSFELSFERKYGYQLEWCRWSINDSNRSGQCRLYRPSYGSVIFRMPFFTCRISENYSVDSQFNCHTTVENGATFLLLCISQTISFNAMMDQCLTTVYAEIDFQRSPIDTWIYRMYLDRYRCRWFRREGKNG